MSSNLMTLPADLPENWQNNQIIAPSGREVGLSDQHGFNYLMKAVNDAHRACNRLREDNERLREELARKADIGVPPLNPLELCSGFTMVNAAELWKTQNGLVVLTFRVGKSGGAIPAGRHLIAEIPEGFRPTSIIHGTGYTISPTGNAGDMQIVIPGNGDLFVDTVHDLPADPETSVAGTIAYFVGQ